MDKKGKNFNPPKGISFIATYVTVDQVPEDILAFQSPEGDFLYCHAWSGMGVVPAETSDISIPRRGFPLLPRRWEEILNYVFCLDFNPPKGISFIATHMSHDPYAHVWAYFNPPKGISFIATHVAPNPLWVHPPAHFNPPKGISFIAT